MPETGEPGAGTGADAGGAPAVPAAPAIDPHSDARALTFWQKFMYALGNFPQGVGPAIVVGWLQYYYTKTSSSLDGKITTDVAAGAALLSYAVFGYIAGGARMMEAIANPIVGYLSDRTTSRFGRRRPFVLFLSPVLALALVAMWFPPVGSASATNGVWLGVTLGLFWLCYAGVVGPYLSLLPEITPYLKERVTLSAIMGVLEVVGMVVSTVLAGIVIDAYRAGVRVAGIPLDGYKLLGVGVGLLTLVCVWLAMRFVRETPHSAAKEVPFQFGTAVKHTLRNRLFVPYVLSVSFFTIGIDSVVVSMPFLVGRVLLKNEDLAGLLQGAVVVFAALMFPLVGWLAGRFGKRRIFNLGLGGFAAGLPLLFFVGTNPFIGWGIVKLLGVFGVAFASPFGAAQIAHIVVVLLIISFPVATRFVLPRAIFADVVDEDEKLTGYRREAMYNGMEGIVSKTAAALVPLITTQLFRLFGAEPGHSLGVLLVGPVAGVFVFLGLVAFLRYPLRD
ncbi:MAG: MFS transporter [Deltaproteobacteria bacterium]|nr:MFS transporter [Deltaproteobacteria bacterium]